MSRRSPKLLFAAPLLPFGEPSLTLATRAFSASPSTLNVSYLDKIVASDRPALRGLTQSQPRGVERRGKDRTCDGRVARLEVSEEILDLFRRELR
jgi:hypothetical protein